MLCQSTLTVEQKLLPNKSRFQQSRTGVVLSPSRCTLRGSKQVLRASEVKTVVTNNGVPEPQGTQPTPQVTGTAPMPAKDDVSGPMLEPSPANKQWVRALAIAAAVAAAAGSTAIMPKNLANFLHVAAYGVWFGTIVWNTFFVGLTMFKVVPRQVFGRIQAKLFPQYFALTTGSNFILLASLLLTGTSAIITKAATTLGLALAGSAANWLIIEPVATKLMFERYDLENKQDKTEDDKARIQSLYKEFGKYHGISSLINLLVFCCAGAYGWFLSSRIVL